MSIKNRRHVGAWGVGLELWTTKSNANPTLRRERKIYFNRILANFKRLFPFGSQHHRVCTKGNWCLYPQMVPYSAQWTQSLCLGTKKKLVAQHLPQSWWLQAAASSQGGFPTAENSVFPPASWAVQRHQVQTGAEVPYSQLLPLLLIPWQKITQIEGIEWRRQ